MKKLILDAACGPRMFWFNKKHPNTVYVDIRKEDAGYIESRKFREVNPDIIMDFTDLKFKDKTFKMVVWDPPHRTDFTRTSIMAKNYGILREDRWEADLKKGFKECWRVLEDYGTLIFKWNERQISVKRVLKLFPETPLFGHPSGSKNKTHWMCFMKIPVEKNGD